MGESLLWLLRRKRSGRGWVRKGMEKNLYDLDADLYRI